MKDSTQRAFIALDEWLGIFTSIYLFEIGSRLFWIFWPLWAVAVYVLSYPFYWWGREERGARTPLRPLKKPEGVASFDVRQV